ncbi:uridine kinase [Congregibacter litoralis]|uniref:Uridine kinase n=1 Tax=Congregibacter litoralis KT71 TaxID=314285 RepID=A4A3T1_9GAMM|nr:uridine kinase [Congregibacter litoralis]EAQ99354.1 uridine kinase [Congregibacter litoralis KT71]
MQPFVIAIAGPSGSGKSLFAETLCEELRRDAPLLDVVLIKEDAYYRDQSHMSLEARETVNYDHPDAIEQDLLASHLEALSAGQAVEVPIYDYTVHSRTAETISVSPAPVIIVEGILLLTHRALREACHIKFYMDTPLDICLLRRMARDIKERGRSLDSVTAQYRESVRPMYHEFIRPSVRHADMVITRGGRNRVALDIVRNMLLSVSQQTASPEDAVS